MATRPELTGRLEGLGAHRVDIGQGPDVTWVVMADPERNELCVASRRGMVGADPASAFGDLFPVAAVVATFDSPAVRAAMPGLLASNRSGWQKPEAWLRLSVRPRFRELLAAGPPGAVDPALDPDDVFDLLLGAVLVRALVPEEVRPRPPIERTVDLLLRTLSADS